jgi:hypothetical protein
VQGRRRDARAALRRHLGDRLHRQRLSLLRGVRRQDAP